MSVHLAGFGLYGSAISDMMRGSYGTAISDWPDVETTKDSNLKICSLTDDIHVFNHVYFFRNIQSMVLGYEVFKSSAYFFPQPI